MPSDLFAAPSEKELKERKLINLERKLLAYRTYLIMLREEMWKIRETVRAVQENLSADDYRYSEGVGTLSEAVHKSVKEFMEEDGSF